MFGLLGAGVVLPIAHLVVDDDGIKNLRTALGLTPTLPDPKAGETAGEYAARTNTTLSDELPADHRYDPWASAPDASYGWWIGPNDPFSVPPGAQLGEEYVAGRSAPSPLTIGLALESTGYLAKVSSPLSFVDNVCSAAAAHGYSVFGYLTSGPAVDGPPTLEELSSILFDAWGAYTGGDVDTDVPQISGSELAAFQAELLLTLGGESGLPADHVFVSDED